MIRIGRVGHEDCASVLMAGAHNSAAEPITNVRRVSLFIFLPLVFVVVFLSSREDRLGIRSSAERAAWRCGTVSATAQVTSAAWKIEVVTKRPDQPAAGARIRNPSAFRREASVVGLISNGSAAPPQIASVQLSENANADVENGRPSRSRGQDRPAASTPLRTRRVPSAGISTVHTP